VSHALPNVIHNEWRRVPDATFAVASILRKDVHPEGLDVDRVRFLEAGTLRLDPGVGHFASVIKGPLLLRAGGGRGEELQLTESAHLYLPAGLEAELLGEPGTEIVRVSSASAAHAPGTHLLVRDEQFLAACGTGAESLRWVLTSQYLSRRIFLHSDTTLLSKSGNPVSWYRTTMFDVAGLPPNEDGEPAFKMAYGSRTEFNVCYDVEGVAQVRMALHPYLDHGQPWRPWLPVDRDSTYHVNETSPSAGRARLDQSAHPPTGPVRNKHEVLIRDGQVTLFCLFDPAPTGMERHRPGEYSDYEPLSSQLGTSEHERYLRDLAEFDGMVDQLSMAKARGGLAELMGSPIWEMYLEGARAETARESALITTLAADGRGRDRVVARWAHGAGR
jgi:hypothetical protein